MALMTYPLNFINYSADDAETWLATRTSGVFAADDFAYSITGEDIDITIGTGLAWIHNHRFAGKVFKNDSDFKISLNIADSNFNRIDVVAIQFDKEWNKTNIVIKEGTAQTNPSLPQISQTETLYELYLYSVYRPAGSLYIQSANITDLRLSEYCGLMADSITKIDTEAINAQITALIMKLEEEIAGVEDGSAFMPKSGGTFTGNAKAATIAGNLAGVRNMAFYDGNGKVTTDNIVFIKCYDK